PTVARSAKVGSAEREGGVGFDPEGVRMFRRLISVLILADALSLYGQAKQAPRLADLKTTAESSGYKSTSTYDDVVRFMKAVDEASPLVHYTTYGKTYDGRDMPLTV